MGVADTPQLDSESSGSAGSNFLAAIYDTNTIHVWFRVNTNGTITCLRGAGAGSVELGTSSGALQAGVWAYVELKVVIHDSAGTVDIRINGTSVLALTDKNTMNTANASWNSVGFGYVTAVGTTPITADFDDLVLFDPSGSYNNIFLGDITVAALYPDGPGTSTDWEDSTGGSPPANWDNVNEAAPNDDTDYNETATINAQDTYTMQDCAAGSDIRAVQIVSAQRKTTEGPGRIKHVVRSNATDYDQAEQGIGGTTYSFLRSILETNPGSGSPEEPWTEGGFNACEIGLIKTG